MPPESEEEDDGRNCVPLAVNWMLAAATGEPSSPYRRAVLQAVERDRYCAATHKSEGACLRDQDNRCFWDDRGSNRSVCGGGDVWEVMRRRASLRATTSMHGTPK